MNYYKTSKGQRVGKSTIDGRVRSAKKQKLDKMYNNYGYYFCEDCKASAGVYLDCSHDISVDKCQKEGKTELAWDIDNITIRCRKCHQKHD